MKKFTTQKYSFYIRYLQKSYFVAIAIIFVFFVQNFAEAKNILTKPNQAKADFLSIYKADLEAVESYLNSIANLSAKFTQKSANGTTEGRFYLARPGKMRIEYINEPKILIVVNGAVLSYKDIELDEVSNLSTNTTPASFLTRTNISFAAKDVEITNVIKNTDSIAISLIKKNRTEAGEFTIIFKTQPNLGFIKMKVTNDLGEETSITLHEVTFPENINNNLFVIRNKNLPF